MEWLIVGFIIGWIANGFARAAYEHYQETQDGKGMYQFPSQETREFEGLDKYIHNEDRDADDHPVVGSQ